MDDDLDALLREHYRAAADRIEVGPRSVRRFQDAGREAGGDGGAVPLRSLARRWAPPLLAAAVTAAVVVAVALLLWPGQGGTRSPEPPRPLAPPESPAASVPPVPSAVPSSPTPSRTAGTPGPSDISGTPRSQGPTRRGATGRPTPTATGSSPPPPTSSPDPEPTQRPGRSTPTPYGR
ncbi:hypothetical protein [Actinomadura sp. NEAU-AAG7]|uniref:hypothetical protein n=1 Tax=Actinomadura sp. NEAU-AAG7 TaxID=2839640 RepID=UPI001BE437B8|nr:hypothetical protein [Actinomadura sp. NEAU-AAG7]MBT2209173.1 hypothetical protein [Actinomadura sp. NEAU-AAG7]